MVGDHLRTNWDRWLRDLLEKEEALGSSAEEVLLGCLSIRSRLATPMAAVLSIRRVSLGYDEEHLRASYYQGPEGSVLPAGVWGRGV